MFKLEYWKPGQTFRWFSYHDPSCKELITKPWDGQFHPELYIQETFGPRKPQIITLICDTCGSWNQHWSINDFWPEGWSEIKHHDWISKLDYYDHFCPKCTKEQNNASK